MRIKSQEGFSLIELLIVVVVLGIVAAIAIPNLLASRRSANESSAISSLRTVHAAQMTYYNTTGEKKYAASLSVLGEAHIIDSVLGCAAQPCVKSGYQFDMSADNTPPNNRLPNWNLTAWPTIDTGVSQTGNRAFYVNEVGVIYYAASPAHPTEGLTEDVRVPTNGTPLRSN